MHLYGNEKGGFMMKKQFIFLLFIFILLLSACSSSDELSGKTFKIANLPAPEEGYIDNPDKYDSIMTVELLDGKVVTDSIHKGQGTYELNDNVLVLHFENENETLKLSFEVEESDKDFSKYSAVISDIDFKITDTDKVSHFENLVFKFDRNRKIEFIEE